MSRVIVPEIDILIAASLWLWQNKVLPIQYSVAIGRDINSRLDRERLIEALDAASVPATPRSFSANGPDILAVSPTQLWQVECKGAGIGTPQTQRNNFDRAIASVVSYYMDEPIPQFPNAIPTLGLALPVTRDYRQLVRTRVPHALRERLNIWLLLYDPIERKIDSVSPDQGLK